VGKQKPHTEIFLSLPYDSKFESLYLSYVCAIHAFGMVPRLTLIPGGARRLDRILSPIRACAFCVAAAQFMFRPALPRQTQAHRAILAAERTSACGQGCRRHR
jgi:hypothetical protein